MLVAVEKHGVLCKHVFTQVQLSLLEYLNFVGATNLLGT